MKRSFVLAALAILLIAGQSFSQTIQEVPWQNDDGTVYINSLVDFVVADTNATGEQLHDVYKLQMGGSYLINQTLNLNNPVTLVADAYDWSDADKKPPVVRVVTVDGAASTGLFFSLGADFYVENIYFAGLGTQSVWMNGNWAIPTAADINITVQSCIFDYMGWCILRNFDANVSGVSYFIDNVYVKNNQQTGDAYTPFLILDTMPIDSLVVTNTTYFQSNGIVIQARNTVNYFELDHCTFANVLKHSIFNEGLTHAKITNNIFYNTMAIGETLQENGDKDRDFDPATGEKYEWGIVNADTLAGNEPGGTDAPMAEGDRVIEVKNNCWWYDQALKDFWAARELVPHSWMNARTRAMFDNDADWPGLVEENTINEDPGFANLTDGNGVSANDLMMTFVNAMRDGNVEDFWGFESDQAVDAELYRVYVDWPITEDLSSTLSIAGTDGQPLGDPKWGGTVTTAVEDVVAGPEGFALGQNYPNPFNPETCIAFSLPAQDYVTLKIYDMTGREIASLIDGLQAAGAHQVRWNGLDGSGNQVASGVYVYQLVSQTTSLSKIRKMLLVR